MGTRGWMAGLALLLAVVAGCGDPPPPVEVDTTTDPWADAGPTPLSLADVSAASGIVTPNHHGRETVKDWMFEGIGPGAAWLDYDNDGFLDLYVPDGDVFANYVLQTPLRRPPDMPATVMRLQREREHVYRDQLWRNNGDGTFTDVAPHAGIVEEHWSFGATACDYDGDGWTDIFVANFGVDVLWRNNGDGTFTDVAEKVGLRGWPWTWSTSASVGDVDGDGRLDFYVSSFADVAAEFERVRVLQGLPPSTPLESIDGKICDWRGVRVYCGPTGLTAQHDRLYCQRPDGTFEDRAERYGLRPRVAHYAFQSVMVDFDEDGLLDIYVANDSQGNIFWRQSRTPDGEIRFTDTAADLGVEVGDHVAAQAGMGVAVADIDGDGQLDLTVTNFAHDYNNLYIGRRPGASFFFVDRGSHVMAAEVFFDLSWGVGWIDFDNDADLDLFISQGHVYVQSDLFDKTGARYKQLNSLFECMDDKILGYREVGAQGQLHARGGALPANLEAGDGMAILECSRGAAFGDYDNDGRMDVFVVNMNAPPSLLHNESRTAGAHWIKLLLQQPGGNRDALGAIVTVASSAEGARRARKMPVLRGSSFLSTCDARLHVGLGVATACDVTVTWPGPERSTTTYRELAADACWRLEREGAHAVRQPLPALRAR